jgi:RHS repeat-associated protein
VAGDPGSGSQSFTYDALDRVTGSSGLAAGSKSYSYDLDGNRVSQTEAGLTKTSAYDRTDQLVSITPAGGSPTFFASDPYGNLTSNAESVASVTAMTYDLADRLTAIDAAGTANDATFTLDALGRFKTRVLAGSTDTYAYAGSAETVVRISNSSGPTITDSIVSPAGDRLGIRQGGTLNWLLADPHGNTGASLDASEATVVSATRYDPYGETLATGSAGGTAVGAANWTYQGRLDVSPSGLASPLYDLSARFYSPGLGTFTQLDSVMGSAQNPLSMNRFLYAEANPASLVDPSGHCARFIDSVCADHRENATQKHQRIEAKRAASRRAERGVENRIKRNRPGIIKRDTPFEWPQPTGPLETPSPSESDGPGAGIPPDECATHPQSCPVANADGVNSWSDGHGNLVLQDSVRVQNPTIRYNGIADIDSWFVFQWRATADADSDLNMTLASDGSVRLRASGGGLETNIRTGESRAYGYSSVAYEDQASSLINGVPDALSGATGVGAYTTTKTEWRVGGLMADPAPGYEFTQVRETEIRVRGNSNVFMSVQGRTEMHVVVRLNRTFWGSALGAFLVKAGEWGPATRPPQPVPVPAGA